LPIAGAEAMKTHTFRNMVGGNIHYALSTGYVSDYTSDGTHRVRRIKTALSQGEGGKLGEWHIANGGEHPPKTDSRGHLPKRKPYREEEDW